MNADRLLSPQLIRLLMAIFGSCLNFYLLVSVVPMYLADAGWGSGGAGLATGAMMFATVLTELTVPALTARFGYRAMLGAGLVLLGVPSLLLPFSSAMPLVLAVSMARGAGFAIMFVADTALVAEIVPPNRRGEGLGLVGVAAGIPAVVGLPLGIQLTGWAGYEVVFVLAGVSALAGLVAVPGLPGRTAANGTVADRTAANPSARVERPLDILRGLGGSGLRRPTVVFGATTLAAGVVMTFLPLAVAADRQSMVAAALLVHAAVAPAARWFAGWYGDRYGASRLLLPSIVLSAVGAAGLVLVDSAVAVIGGMVLFGLGFGAAQNVTLAMMFDRVGTSEYGKASALWSLAYDGGIGIGAVGFGAVVGFTGYPTAFGLTALLLFAAVLPALRSVTQPVKPCPVRPCPAVA
jgi:MFS family permease